MAKNANSLPWAKLSTWRQSSKYKQVSLLLMGFLVTGILLAWPDAKGIGFVCLLSRKMSLWDEPEATACV